MGASLETGNRGVSALAASLIQIFNTLKPTHNLSFLIGNCTPKSSTLSINGQLFTYDIVNYRLSPGSKMAEHLFCILFVAFIQPFLPKSISKQLVLRVPWLKALYEADFVGDIHGGDSFSDIYGFRRFLLGALPDLIVLMMKKPLILLPQTYGPYRNRTTKCIARYILKNARTILARDKEGLVTINNLLGEDTGPETIFCPDVAFTLESVIPSEITTSPPIAHKASAPLIGINVNGLLFNGGYTRSNMFGLRFEYRSFVFSLITELLKETHADILLIPHTFGPPGNINNDLDASYAIISSLRKYNRRVTLVTEEYDQSSIKGIIKSCDFFIGSRMHSCIAALSQAIPTVGIAYSLKFKGVFESIGAGHTVLDARHLDEKTILRHILTHYNDRNKSTSNTQNRMLEVQKQVFDTFYSILNH